MEIRVDVPNLTVSIGFDDFTVQYSDNDMAVIQVSCKGNLFLQENH